MVVSRGKVCIGIYLENPGEGSLVSRQRVDVRGRVDGLRRRSGLQVKACDDSWESWTDSTRSEEEISVLTCVGSYLVAGGGHDIDSEDLLACPSPSLG